MTTSASAASALAAVVPVEPTAPTELRMVVAAASPCPPGSRRPGCRSARTNARQRVVRAGVDRRRRPPRSAACVPSGSISAARAITERSGSGRAICQVRSANSDSGQSKASACTSWGSDDRRRTRLDGIGQHPHRTEQCGGQLLGPPHPVEVPRQRFERVVDGDVAAGRQLQLLQHRRAHPGGEGVRGQQQHRQPVDGGQRRAGEHVGRAGADAGGDRPGSAADPSGGRRRRRCAPWPARCGPERTSGPALCPPRRRRPRPAAAPGRCPPRCRGRRCRRQPAKNLCRTPSRSTYWLARKRTVAWATVSRTVGFGVGELLGSLRVRWIPRFSLLGRGAGWAVERRRGSIVLVAPSCHAARCGRGRRRSARRGSGPDRPSR